MTSQTIQKRHTAPHLVPDGFKSNNFSLLLSSLAINVLSLALPIMTLQVYDRILPNPSSGTLPVLITGVCIVVFLEAIMRLCRAYSLGRKGAVYEHLMSCSAMGHLLKADLSKLSYAGVGEYLQHMSGFSKLKDFYNGYALVTLFDLIFIPIFLTLIAYIGGILVCIPLFVITLFSIISLYQGSQLQEALAQREQDDGRRFNFLIETLEGIHSIKAFALEKFFERRYEHYEEKSSHANYKATQETATMFNTGAIFSHLIVISVIVCGAILVLNGKLTTGALIASLLLSGRIMQPIQKALGLWARYQDFKLAKNNINKLFQTPTIQYDLALQDNTPSLKEGQITLDNISLSFGTDQPNLLNNISLSIAPKEILLIEGQHGVGKTVLLDTIAGIYPLNTGNITIDNIPLSHFTAAKLAQHIGFIRTESTIFRGSIRDNLTCFNQHDTNAVREISALLNVDKDIAKLPSGYDTFLNGNNSDSIPPGLKQRIAMVRVLAPKPRIILFDNADRALDRNGYNMVYNLLARLKGKVTMILISDDRNIRALADRVYTLEKGSIYKTPLDNEQRSISANQELRL